MSMKKKVATLITMCAVTTSLFGVIENVKIVKAAEMFFKEELLSNNDKTECIVENYNNFEMNSQFLYCKS